MDMQDLEARCNAAYARGRAAGLREAASIAADVINRLREDNENDLRAARACIAYELDEAAERAEVTP